MNKVVIMIITSIIPDFTQNHHIMTVNSEIFTRYKNSTSLLTPTLIPLTFNPKQRPTTDVTMLHGWKAVFNELMI